MSTKWLKLICNRRELQLVGTLNGGQSFRWKNSEVDEHDCWVGVFASKIWLLRQDEDHILYQVYSEESSDIQLTSAESDELLRNYFQLDRNLEECYAKWSAADANFKTAAEQFYGIRILKQDPVENIFSFISSSNNHISRISSMVEKLATFYGKPICTISGTMYYSFPNVEALAQNGVEEKLRENGFGYRAKYIASSATAIMQKGGGKWLDELKGMEYGEAKRNLMTLPGIGAKVADCICLMSLGHLQAIPVDTHVYQIAARHYMPKLTKQKSLTDKIYNEIGEHFRGLYGPLAGWAHTVLFCADLKKFQVGKKENKDAAKRPGKRKLAT